MLALVAIYGVLPIDYELGLEEVVAVRVKQAGKAQRRDDGARDGDWPMCN